VASSAVSKLARAKARDLVPVDGDVTAVFL
jgi:hypothetical protein